MLWFLLDGRHDLQGSFNEGVRDVDVEILLGENVNQHIGRLNNLSDVDHQLPGLKKRLPMRVPDVEVVDARAKGSIDLHLRRPLLDLQIEPIQLQVQHRQTVHVVDENKLKTLDDSLELFFYEVCIR